MRHFLLVFLCATGLSACSTIIDGTSQEILVNTNPPGASCNLERLGTVIATVPKTPAAAMVKKTKEDITTRCTKDGHQEATYMDNSGTAGATFGNIVAGGVIGWGVDSATGSDNKYDSPVNITLLPVQK